MLSALSSLQELHMRLFDAPLPRDVNHRAFWNTPPVSAAALAIVRAARHHAGIVVAVTHDTHASHALEADLRTFTKSHDAAGSVSGNDLEVLHFPDWETLPYDLFAPHPQI